jgi:hypothetical protein
MKDWASKISRSRIGPYLVNGSLSYLPRREFGKHSSNKSMLAQRLYLRFFENQEIHTFG